MKRPLLFIGPTFRGQREAFVLAQDTGEMFVAVKFAGIPQFCILSDGIPLVSFGKARTNPYINLDTAIAWHHEESRHGNASRHAAFIESLTNWRDRIAAGGPWEAA